MFQRRIVMLAAAICFSSVCVQQSNAENWICGDIDICVVDDTVNVDNVIVEDGGTLIATDLGVVHGNVVVLPGGNLISLPFSGIEGNVVAKGAALIDIEIATIGGNVVVCKATGDVTVDGSEINGNLVVSRNEGPSAEVAGNVVTGNVIANGNQSPLLIEFNTISRNLIVLNNDDYTVENNTVGGIEIVH